MKRRDWIVLALIVLCSGLALLASEFLRGRAAPFVFDERGPRERRV